MEPSKRTSSQPLQVAIAAVCGLLVFVAVVGFVGLILNFRVANVTNQALSYDVELEDKGDDLRVAVLDVRHYQRNIYFAGYSRGGLSDFEGAYVTLLQEIDELEELGIRDEGVAQPQELREMARDYYEDFRPTIESDVGSVGTDAEARGEFDLAHERALESLELIESEAAGIDELGEQRSGAALGTVEDATANARYVLLSVLGGLVLVGALLAYAAVRVVSELRRLYAGEQLSAEALSEANRAKTDFIADASHELRTPLTVLHGNAQIGLQFEERPDQREVFSDILRESTRMSRMVEDLLFLARSDSASLPLKQERLELEPFIHELASRAAALAHERGVSFSQHLGGDGMIYADPGRIEQAVLVFVDNAAKYSPAGTPVNLTTETTADELLLHVIDEGPGIPEEELSRVFERFYRVDKTRARKQGGSGLGLSISATIAEAHDGRISVASREGEGTRMTLLLPLIPTPAESEAPDGQRNAEEQNNELEIGKRNT